MGLLTPVALGLAALAMPIIALYLLKIRRPVRTVPSLLLWEQLTRDIEASHPWQRFRPNWLLLLQLLVLLALVAALARPVVYAEARLGTSTVVILDVSASMSATDTENGDRRLDNARKRIHGLIDQMPGNGQMLLVTAGAQAKVIQPMTSDRGQLRRALDAVSGESGTAALHDALALASAAAARLPDGEIVVVSDGSVPEALIAPLDVPVRLVQVGSDAPVNIGITSMAVRRGPQGDHVFIRLINTGPTDRSVRLTLNAETDATVLAAQDMVLPAADGRSLSLPVPDRVETLRAELSAFDNDRDDLALDNVAWARVRASEPTRILILTEGNLFLERAFSLLPDVTVGIAPTDAGVPPGYDLYVFDGVIPPSRLDGPAMLLNPPAGTDWVTVEGDLTTPRITTTLNRDDRLLGVELLDVNIAAARQVISPSWGTVLAASEGGPMLIAGNRDGAPTVVLAFDLHQSDLPLRTAFPILIANLAEYLVPGLGAVNSAAVTPGQPITLPPRSGADQAEIIAPDGSVESIMANGGVVTRTESLGAYEVRYLAQREIIRYDGFTVSLLDPAESSLRPDPTFPGETAAGIVSSGLALRADAVRPITTLMIALGFLVLLAEWWVFFSGRRGIPSSLGPWRGPQWANARTRYVSFLRHSGRRRP